MFTNIIIYAIIIFTTKKKQIFPYVSRLSYCELSYLSISRANMDSFTFHRISGLITIFIILNKLGGISRGDNDSEDSLTNWIGKVFGWKCFVSNRKHI